MSSLLGERDDAAGADIRSATFDEIDEMERRGELFPTRANADHIELDDSFWKNARLIMPNDGPKASVHLRIDGPVLNWFKAQGKGHLTRMNAVLRAYYESHRPPLNKDNASSVKKNRRRA